MAARVVLPPERRPGPHLEIALLAAQPPEDRTGLAVELVDRARVARRDEVVAVRLLLDRVDVEVVVRVAGRRAAGARQRDVRLVDRDLVEAVPVEEDLARRDVDLLDDAVGDLAVL